MPAKFILTLTLHPENRPVHIDREWISAVTDLGERDHTLLLVQGKNIAIKEPMEAILRKLDWVVA